MISKLDISSLSLVSGSIETKKEALRIFVDEENSFSLSCKDFALYKTRSASEYLCLDLSIKTDRMPTVYVEFIKHQESEEKVLRIRYFMIPNVRAKMVIQLSELDSHRYFLPAYPGSFKGHVEGEPTDISCIDEIRIRMIHQTQIAWMDLFSIEVRSDFPDMTVSGPVMVDELGQRIGKTWPQKMEDSQQLCTYLHALYAEAQKNNQYPQHWSKYGGYKKLRFNATGFFHTHYDKNRWYLVDPDGYAFISNGVCYGARMGVHGFVDCMQDLFAWLPELEDSRYKDCWTEASAIAEFVKRNSAETGKGRLMFNFARANMIRAFGPDHWWDAWLKITTARFKYWGINTIGVGVNTYTDERVHDFLAQAKIPFVVTLQEFPRTKQAIFRDFPDVFSKEYEDACEQYAKEQVAPYVGNPYCIGFFLTNEPEWLFQDSVNPAQQILAYKGSLASKDALLAFLCERYKTIEALNQSWHTEFSAFSDLQKPIMNADFLTSNSNKDLALFRKILIKKYCEVPSKALSAAAPQHLNLGMRYNRLSKNELAGNEYVSVCSFNCYRSDPNEMLDILTEQAQIPGLIGEWHVAANEARNFASGLVSTPNQEERVKAWRFYIHQAISHPMCIGLHYFELNDQPLLGRFDGECMQHGLISVCNVAYPELSEAMHEFSQQMYELANQTIQPTTVKGEIHGYHA